MANIAGRIRAPLTVALVLTVFAVVPWYAQPPQGATAAAQLPRTLDFSMSDVPAWPLAPIILPPSPFRDARPYPEGMVITPPAIDGAIVLWDHSPLASVLSALFAPWLALSS